jgi:NDP-sugar pyrophosphorylase family protein
VSEILTRKVNSLYPVPVTAPQYTENHILLQIMQMRHLRHLPLLDENGQIAGLVAIDDLLPNELLPPQAVIMAGGRGLRLRPLTDTTPKPMLPVGDRPIMERIIDQLRAAGIQRVCVTTHYMPEKIMEYFGDGQAFGVEIRYVAEGQPLGTVGGLGLIDAPSEPLLVINGDIVTRVNFRAMMLYHHEHNADLTMAVRPFNMQVPYGVIETEGLFVRQLREKPTLSFMINAGIYVMEPSVHKFIPNGLRFDMPDLIERLLQDNRPIASFPIVEYWSDIGQFKDYERAHQDASNGEL